MSKINIFNIIKLFAIFIAGILIILLIAAAIYYYWNFYEVEIVFRVSTDRSAIQRIVSGAGGRILGDGAFGTLVTIPRWKNINEAIERLKADSSVEKVSYPPLRLGDL